MSVKGVKKAKRMPKPGCGPHCFYKCHSYLDEIARATICRKFWELKNIERQRDYVAHKIKRYEVKDRRVQSSRRRFTQSYTLTYLDNTYRVCKKFFLHTLDVSEKMVRTALSKCQRSEATVLSPDKRGKHPPGRKLPEEIRESIEEHINSFPTVPAHWCRKDTGKVYLESILNKEIMYSFYQDYCKQIGFKPASKTMYKEALLRKNIGFYVPRKDQCWCYEFEHKTGEEKFHVSKNINDT